MSKEISNKIYHECSHCGKCCKNRGDISLTPLDVLNMSKYLTMSVKDFISKYCDLCEDHDVRLRVKGNNYACTFLQMFSNGRTSCEVYKVRPMACYLYPLRMLDYLNVFRTDEMAPCPKTKKAIPVKEFVDKKSNKRYEREFAHIQKFTRVLNMYLENPHGQSEQEAMEYFYYNSSEVEIEKKLDNYIKTYSGE